jgi:ElaB/YqjD/DUF883 family membrane-anchored ribosome-binding protein
LEDGMTLEADGAEAASAAETAIKDAEKTLHSLVERLERVVHDALDIAKSRSKVYVDGAGEQIETAQKYVAERVQERPLAATATAIGIGVVIGILLSGRNR